MQQQSLVPETTMINPRDYFVKRPRDAKKAQHRIGVRYSRALLDQLVKGRTAMNMLSL